MTKKCDCPELGRIERQLDAIHTRMESAERSDTQLQMELMLMRRSLLRCQARCHVLAEPPRGWRAVFYALRNLVLPTKDRERRQTDNMSVPLQDVLPPKDNGDI